MKTRGLLLLPLLLAGCPGNGIVRTGRAYPPLAKDAPVEAFLGEKRPEYSEIGVRILKRTGLFESNPLGRTVEIVKEEARELGGDCVILVSATPTEDVVDYPTGGPSHTSATQYRFIVGRLKPASPSPSLSSAATALVAFCTSCGGRFPDATMRFCGSCGAARATR